MTKLTNFKCNEQRNINFDTPEVWTDDNDGRINVRKTSKWLGVIELNDKEAEDVMTGIACELMKKQDQRRRFCPCCGAQLE